MRARPTAAIIVAILAAVSVVACEGGGLERERLQVDVTLEHPRPACQAG